MRIGIDARFVGPQGTGLGKYTEKLILNLAEIDKKNHYSIFLRKNNWDYLVLNKNFKKVLADIPWYSIKEQVKMPAIFNLENLDILHIPHFNAPFFYRKKFVVTIHDLIHHYFQETSATTRNEIVFGLKKIGYQFIIRNAIKKSKKIIVPSNFVKEDIIGHFNISPEKIVVTYEAAEEEYFKKNGKWQTANGKFLIYVGNAYPHKNLNRLLDAFKILTTDYGLRTTKLVLVCPRDTFQKRLDHEIQVRGLGTKVAILGYQAPNDLARLFSKASAYVFPSLSEGFGIPGLNAMASGLPVVCSNSPTLKEIYTDAALYFNPNDPKDIAVKIKNVLSNTKVRSDLIEKGKEQAKKYSWRKMAQLTLKTYHEA